MTYDRHRSCRKRTLSKCCTCSTFAFPELHVPYPAKETFAALFWVPNSPHINTAGCRWRGERPTLMPFTANMIFTTEQQAQNSEVKERVYIYIKKAHTCLTLSFLHPFWPKKKKKSLQLFFLWIYSLQCYCQGTKGNREKYKLRMKLKEKKRKKQQ